MTLSNLVVQPVYRSVSTSPPRDCRPSEIRHNDLSPIYRDLADLRALAAQIRHAAENTGFFYIKNHGIPASVIAEAQRQAEAFFHQSDSEKEVVSKEKPKYFNGWSP